MFPEPGPLEGVKSLSKFILKMTDVTFQYPTRTAPTVMGINLEVSRVSRVAVIGPNGAGKSTAIKLLIGELTPSQGQIQKHPNMRLAYVAQHAFHHLEKHLNETPAQYIMWRFAGNEDKEGIELINQKKDSADKKEIIKYWIRDGTTLVPCMSPQEEKLAVEPEALLSRHENKKDKTKEYEVKWRLKSSDCNLWVKREILISMGAEKLVQKCDERIAAESGLMFRPLTTAAIEKHLADFGIEAEDASHTLIKSLSGGQKIKVVLAASLWLNPHIIVLDEPTNYVSPATVARHACPLTWMRWTAGLTLACLLTGCHDDAAGPRLSRCPGGRHQRLQGRCHHHLAQPRVRWRRVPGACRPPAIQQLACVAHSRPPLPRPTRSYGLTRLPAACLS